MNTAFIARQKIFNRNNKLFAYELLFRDTDTGIKDFPTNLKATSSVIMNSLTNMDIGDLLDDCLGFINVDHDVLNSNVIDILDKDKFVLEILETTELTDKLISKIKQLRSRGFTFAIDDFDCSAEMIVKFNPLLKYVSYIKMDVMAAEPENLKRVMLKLRNSGIKILAEKVETEKEYNEYLDMKFDFFQGYYLHKPETIELSRFKESTKLVVLELIKLIRKNSETAELERFIKRQPELSFKLIKFLNNQKGFNSKKKIESIVQVITLLGRVKLAKWLMIYLYAESENPAAEGILEMAIKRAEAMENDAAFEDKDRAYLAGMFSMMESIFETPMGDIMKEINMDPDITNLVIYKKGPFAGSLMRAESIEREHLRELMIANFDKIATSELVQTLEYSGVTTNKIK